MWRSHDPHGLHGGCGWMLSIGEDLSVVVGFFKNCHSSNSNSLLQHSCQSVFGIDVVGVKVAKLGSPN